MGFNEIMEVFTIWLIRLWWSYLIFMIVLMICVLFEDFPKYNIDVENMDKYDLLWS